MAKINAVERINYAGGLLGLFFGSSKGKLGAKILDMKFSGLEFTFNSPRAIKSCMVYGSVNHSFLDFRALDYW